MQEVESRPKTSQRIRYETQIEVIRKKRGGLESIRNQLGFSQKQMCELLLVDPSAWSRWNRPGEDAPAHIYQALDWYMSMREISPPVSPLVFKGQAEGLTFIESQAASEMEQKIVAWEQEKNQLVEKLKRSEELQAGWKLFLILNSVVLGYLILSHYFSL